MIEKFGFLYNYYALINYDALLTRNCSTIVVQLVHCQLTQLTVGVYTRERVTWLYCMFFSCFTEFWVKFQIAWDHLWRLFLVILVV